MGASMRFNRLSAAFYSQYGAYGEILDKASRPYYVFLMQLDDLTYAIPLRSNISHGFCFIADNSNGQNSGLDYSKAVVIIDVAKYIDPADVTIRQNEYNVLKQHELTIRRQFASYVAFYKKEFLRRQKNPALPPSPLCDYASLKYFHNELGLSSP
jgi:protein AbiQ